MPEVLVIADHLKRTLLPSEVQELRKRMDEYQATVARHPSGKGLALCPLNVDGACSIYEVRPTVCRSFNSTDAAACERALANEWKTTIPMDYAPICAEIAVQTGYRIAGLLHDQPYFPVPLVPALGLALDHPDKINVEDYGEIALPIESPDSGGSDR